MPVVYACICPTASPSEDSSSALALHRISVELSGYEPELVALVAAAASGATKIGVFAGTGLVDRVIAEAKKDAVPAERLMRWTAAGPPLAIDGPAWLRVATCSLGPREHFAFGRAAGRALDADEQRIVVICAVELSRGNAQFDTHYRRAIASWDVKSLVNMDASFRIAAGEHAVAQTAVLMGALSGYRVQTRELSYGAAQIVTAIDVLGSRRGSR